MSVERAVATRRDGFLATSEGQPAFTVELRPENLAVEDGLLNLGVLAVDGPPGENLFDDRSVLQRRGGDLWIRAMPDYMPYS